MSYTVRCNANNFDPTFFDGEDRIAAEAIVKYLKENPEPPAFVEYQDAMYRPFDQDFSIIRIVGKSHHRYNMRKMSAIIGKETKANED